MSEPPTYAQDDSVAGDPAEDPTFEQLLQFLKESRSFDFTGYKRPSLVRRVRHRMRELGLDSYENYADVLQLQPAEFTELFNTILINVTSFFRDPDAWEHLRTDVLPQLLAGRDGSPLRVWSAGAASGQEAYSIAMLLHDTMGSEFRDQVKIYATDVDEEALSYARQAAYRERELVGLPEHYRNRYLERVSDRYLIHPDIRRSVIFGRNDLTRDAPISRIDILLCRNTLMYFNAETQARVVDRLGFALRPYGILFLGRAEMLVPSAVFDPVDAVHRLFRRARADLGDTSLGVRRTSDEDDADEQLREEILATNPVAQIAVAADGRLALVNHRARGMLGLSERDLGRPFQDLDVSYRPIELRALVARVADERAAVWVREVEWRRSGPNPVFLDLHLAPLLDDGGDVQGTSISFFDVTRFRQLRVEVESANRQLERAYEELQSTNEELETTNEELQSTVEELETMNEELQSSNEELETMNEELQSSNDELQSTNEQLHSRTTELGELNGFMRSIVGSLAGAVIVVDAALVVQVWTSRSVDLWGLRAEEAVGQALMDLDGGMPTAELYPWVRSVIDGRSQVVLGRAVTAVDRHGHPVQLRVSVSRLQSDEAQVRGALVVMEVSETGGRADASG